MRLCGLHGSRVDCEVCRIYTFETNTSYPHPKPLCCSPPKETSVDPGLGAADAVLQSALSAWPVAMEKLQRPSDAPADAAELTRLLAAADAAALDAFHEQMSRTLYNSEAP